MFFNIPTNPWKHAASKRKIEKIRVEKLSSDIKQVEVRMKVPKGKTDYEVTYTIDTMYVFTQSQGKRIPVGIEKNGDSIVNDFGHTFRYQVIEDSILIGSGSNFKDTLYKMDASFVTINEINTNDTVNYTNFKNKFFQRSIAHYHRLGYKDYWDYLEKRHGPFEEEEEIIYE